MNRMKNAFLLCSFTAIAYAAEKATDSHSAWSSSLGVQTSDGDTKQRASDRNGRPVSPRMSLILEMHDNLEKLEELSVENQLGRKHKRFIRDLVVGLARIKNSGAGLAGNANFELVGSLDGNPKQLEFFADLSTEVTHEPTRTQNAGTARPQNAPEGNAGSLFQGLMQGLAQVAQAHMQGSPSTVGAGAVPTSTSRLQEMAQSLNQLNQQLPSMFFGGNAPVSAPTDAVRPVAQAATVLQRDDGKRGFTIADADDDK